MKTKIPEPASAGAFEQAYGSGADAIRFLPRLMAAGTLCLVGALASLLRCIQPQHRMATQKRRPSSAGAQWPLSPRQPPSGPDARQSDARQSDASGQMHTRSDATRSGARFDGRAGQCEKVFVADRRTGRRSRKLLGHLLFPGRPQRTWPSGDSGPRGVVRLWDRGHWQAGSGVSHRKEDVWFYNARFLPDGEHVVTAYSNDRNIHL